MNAQRSRISRFQLFFLLVQSQIGIGLLSLPSDIQKSAGGDGWLSVLVAGAVTQVLLLVFWALCRRFPQRTLPEISVLLFGKRGGKAVNGIFFACFIAVASLASALYIRTIGNWLLILTPKWILLLLVLATCVYMALENLRMIARFYVISSFMFVILFLMSVLNFKNEMHLSYLLPVGKSGLDHILVGSHSTFFAMLGFEIFLFGFAHVAGQPRKLFATASLANLFVTIFYAYFVAICLVSFSPNALSRVNDPLLFMFKGLSYQVIERLDLIFLALWIIPMTTSIITYLYMAGKSIAIRTEPYRKAMLVSSGLIFATGYWFAGMNDMDLVGHWIQNVYLIALAVLPSAMLLLSFARRTTDQGALP
ncbi:GerAB/ArcD/ProY family transporter [Cohnella sp. GCM10027633]|uniref:GerAB/ArcD/ProY family transporter n=1 Tax=unclassified Cohnella TaxID=2636738 RepID=UPI003628693A